MNTILDDCLVVILTEVYNDPCEFFDRRMVCKRWFKLITEDVIVEHATVCVWKDGNEIEIRAAYSNVVNLWIVQERKTKKAPTGTRKINKKHIKSITGSSIYKEYIQISQIPIKIIDDKIAIQAVKSNNIRLVGFILYTRISSVSWTFVKDAYVVAVENNLIDMIKTISFCSTNHYSSAVITAFDKQDVVMVKFLVSLVKITFEEQLKYIWHAISSQGVKGLEFLLECGVPIDVMSDAALRYVAQHGNVEVFKFAEEHGANIFDKDILKWAIEFRQFDIVKLLCPETRKFEDYYNLYRAIVSREDDKFANFLINHPNFDFTAEDNYLLYKACSKERVDIVKLLLSHRTVNPTACRFRALKAAVKSENYDIVKLLLENNRLELPLGISEIIINLCEKFQTN